MNYEDALVFAKQEGEWKPIPKLSKTVPFGYEIDPDNEKQLLPVPIELHGLELAKKHLKRYSYREVANWLSESTGRYISHVGLKKRIESERSRKTRSRTLKGWATRLEKTLKEVERINQEVPGATFKEKSAG